MDQDSDESLDFIDLLSEQSNLPFLINDSGAGGVNLSATSDVWAKKLAKKLTGLAQSAAAATPPVEADPPFPLAHGAKPATTDKSVELKKSSQTKTSGTHNNMPKAANASQLIDVRNRKPTEAADLNVWVLGASLGGPQAVRQFLAAVHEDLPVTFILAQHIGANHVALLADQLNRVTKFNVVPGKTGHKLQHKEVILTPADKQLTFTDDAFIALRPAPPAAVYSPSIDNVMTEVARCFGAKAGTIIFSGMGNDGAKGCEEIAEKGGIVWAQDIASCVISSMPDHARSTGTVTYSAKPEQLAKHLFEYYAG
jgi:chemotaxis response regulator CheB